MKVISERSSGQRPIDIPAISSFISERTAHLQICLQMAICPENKEQIQVSGNKRERAALILKVREGLRELIQNTMKQNTFSLSIYLGYPGMEQVYGIHFSLHSLEDFSNYLSLNVTVLEEIWTACQKRIVRTKWEAFCIFEKESLLYIFLLQ